MRTFALFSRGDKTRASPDVCPTAWKTKDYITIYQISQKKVQ
jgi:hypothetical protein